MSEPTPPPYRTPFAELRGPPPPPPRKRGRLHSLMQVVKSGSIITLVCTTSAGSCGLVAGGWHGVLFATTFFAAMGVLGMTIGVVVALLLDSSRAARESWKGAPIVRTEVLERGAGQLAVAGPSSGALAHPRADRRPAQAPDLV